MYVFFADLFFHAVSEENIVPLLYVMSVGRITQLYYAHMYIFSAIKQYGLIFLYFCFH